LNDPLGFEDELQGDIANSVCSVQPLSLFFLNSKLKATPNVEEADLALFLGLARAIESSALP
jgi:hypothetical protein